MGLLEKNNYAITFGITYVYTCDGSQDGYEIKPYSKSLGDELKRTNTEFLGIKNDDDRHSAYANLQGTQNRFKRALESFVKGRNGLLVVSGGGDLRFIEDNKIAPDSNLATGVLPFQNKLEDSIRYDLSTGKASYLPVHLINVSGQLLSSIGCKENMPYRLLYDTSAY